MSLEVPPSAEHSRGASERATSFKRGQGKETGSKRGADMLSKIVDLRREKAREKPRQIREVKHSVYRRYEPDSLADDVEKVAEKQREKWLKLAEKHPEDSNARQKAERAIERRMEYFLRAERDKELRNELRSLDRSRRLEFSREVKKLHKADRDARQAL